VLANAVAEHGEAATEVAPTAKEIFLQLFGHVQAHQSTYIDFGGYKIIITNHTIMQLLALVLAFLIFYYITRLAQKSDRPRGLIQNMFESVVLYVRDQMVRPSMPREFADKLMPLFLTFFVFILFCNLLGLIPIPGIGGTATSNINVTMGLATITLAVMIGGGMKAVGPGKFWTSLVPHGVPSFVLPILFLIEVLSLFIKAFALTIRLFANMIAGHLVILSFFGIVFLFTINSGQLVGGCIAVPALLMTVFVTLLEVLVAFIQAYVFTFLSILFISMCVHPEH